MSIFVLEHKTPVSQPFKIIVKRIQQERNMFFNPLDTEVYIDDLIHLNHWHP